MSHMSHSLEDKMEVTKIYHFKMKMWLVSMTMVFWEMTSHDGIIRAQHFKEHIMPSSSRF
jgi:hypothetical protein